MNLEIEKNILLGKSICIKIGILKKGMRFLLTKIWNVSAHLINWLKKTYWFIKIPLQFWHVPRVVWVLGVGANVGELRVVSIAHWFRIRCVLFYSQAILFCGSGALLICLRVWARFVLIIPVWKWRNNNIDLWRC